MWKDVFLLHDSSPSHRTFQTEKEYGYETLNRPHFHLSLSPISKSLKVHQRMPNHNKDNFIIASKEWLQSHLGPYFLFFKGGRCMIFCKAAMWRSKRVFIKILTPILFPSSAWQRNTIEPFSNKTT